MFVIFSATQHQLIAQLFFTQKIILCWKFLNYLRLFAGLISTLTLHQLPNYRQKRILLLFFTSFSFQIQKSKSILCFTLENRIQSGYQFNTSKVNKWQCETRWSDLLLKGSFEKTRIQFQAFQQKNPTAFIPISAHMQRSKSIHYENKWTIVTKCACPFVRCVQCWHQKHCKFFNVAQMWQKQKFVTISPGKQQKNF
eukprot:EC096390.1.p1 GENE.EC096390.1~~EC096390.1.p1  ORF type:complete len:197 (-),score=7.21 EC096390.1:35-625(-)